jgi:hypothetical protein
VQYPGPDEFSEDDLALLSQVIAVHRARLKHFLGFSALASFPAPQVPADLTVLLGPAGELQLDLDYDALLVAIRAGANRTRLNAHGLLGPHLRFKVGCLSWADRVLFPGGSFLFSRGAMMTVGGIVDKIIDSVLDATGTGTTIREIGDVASDVIGGAIDT